MKTRENKNTVVFFLMVFNLLIFLGHLFAANDNLVRDEITSRAQVEYKAEGLRDPFQTGLEAKKEEAEAIAPKESVSLTLPTLNVEGIIWGTSIPQAIINKKVAKIGDVVEGAQVTEIKKDGVKVIFNNQEYKLPSPVLRPIEPKGGENEKKF